MVAIVIPYFKLTFLEETLSSLACQTNKKFQVYIGDDASPEDPSLLVKRFERKLNLKYHRFQENLGSVSLTKHWERCIDLSENEPWIMILGDDDYISKNYIEDFYNHLEEVESNKIQVVRFATRIVTPPGNKISDKFVHPVIEAATDSFFRKFFKHSRGSLSEQIFRREAYIRKGFRDFPLGWGADNFAWLDFTDFGKIYTINSATAFFRISNLNISRGGYKEDVKLEAKFQYFTIIVNKYLDHFEFSQQIKILSLYEWLAFRTGNLKFGTSLKILLFFIRKGKFLEAIKFPRRVILLYPKRI